MDLKQIDCFNINFKIWKTLAIWPGNNPHRYYKYYSKIFIIFFVIIYDILYTVNFFFLPKQLDIFIEQMMFYFMELSLLSKLLTFIFMYDKIKTVFDILENDIFQADTEEESRILREAKLFIKKYWKIVAAISITSHVVHVSTPLISHLLFKNELSFPVCSYSFLSESFIKTFQYPLYFYQSIGMHFHMQYNINIDTYFLGVLILIIAQLDILNLRFCNLKSFEDQARMRETVLNLNKSLDHYNHVVNFCYLVEDIFSITLFVQFGVASCIICICLFRFTMPAPFEYYIFLTTYMFIMIMEIMVPCWFGNKIIEKSVMLSSAIYNSEWISSSKEFKRNMRIFVERANKPLSITGGKMFPISLTTFTSIMNSAYSFFTLLRYMQSREE